jgi:hypothetical protein
MRLSRRSSSNASTVEVSSASTGGGIALQHSHGCCRGCVDDVVLAAAAAGQLTHPGGRSRRDIHDGLATRSQPLGKVTAKPASVLHRPPPFAELPRPAQQPPVTGQRRIDLQRSCRLVNRSIEGTRCVGRLMRIHSYDDHPWHAFRPAGQQRGTVDDTPTSSTGQTVSPLLSQTTAWRRPARQTPGEPARRRQAIHESGRPAPARDVRSTTSSSRRTHTSRRFS